MKICENCGHVHLSELEKRILNILPEQTNLIATELGKNRKDTHVTLSRMEKLGLIKRIGKTDKNIIWEEICKE